MCDKIFKVVQFIFSIFMLLVVSMMVPLFALFEATDCESYKKEIVDIWKNIYGDLMGAYHVRD